MYIIFEGIVASGKTTHSKKLYDYLKKKFPKKDVVWTREPGGTEIAKSTRKIVQGTKFNEEMEGICEAYLYAASRAQSLRQIVKPIQDVNGIVVADRSFITSMAFQGYGRDVGVNTILKINETAIDDILPDLVVLLDLDTDIALSRVFDQEGDKFERMGKEFFEKVREGYEEISKMDMFKDRWLTIKLPRRGGRGKHIKENFELILEHLEPYIDSIK